MNHIQNLELGKESGSYVADFLLALRGFVAPESTSWIFRGQRNGKLKLRPQVGRLGPLNSFQKICSLLKKKGYGRVDRRSRSHDYDLEQFKLWQQEAAAVDPNLPKNIFERLAYAQHYGLATRLIDWSNSALVALYFATEEIPFCKPSGKDGVVFAFRATPPIDIERETFDSIDTPRVLRVRPFDSRLSAQSGCFTYHPDPLDVFNPKPHDVAVGGDLRNKVSLLKIRIPFARKKKTATELAQLGMTRKTLFPDREGVSFYVNWEMTKFFGQ